MSVVHRRVFQAKVSRVLIPLFLIAASASALTTSIIHGEINASNAAVAFAAEGRLTDAEMKSGSRTMDVRVSADLGGPFAAGETTNCAWQGGTSSFLPFELRYDPASGEVTFTINGNTALHQTVADPTSLRDIFIRAPSSNSTWKIIVNQMTLDDENICGSLSSAAESCGPRTMKISGALLSDGFVLRGRLHVVLPPSSPHAPRNPNPAIHIFVGAEQVAPPDSDGDGLPDDWETDNGLDPQDPSDGTDDDDDDGATNFEEYRAGTNPQDALSRFRISIRALSPAEAGTSRTLANSPEAPGAEVEWPSISNRTYSVWRATRINAGEADFVKIASGLPSDAPFNFYQDFTATNAAIYFYRVQIDP